MNRQGHVSGLPFLRPKRAYHRALKRCEMRCGFMELKCKLSVPAREVWRLDHFC